MRIFIPTPLIWEHITVNKKCVGRHCYLVPMSRFDFASKLIGVVLLFSNLLKRIIRIFLQISAEKKTLLDHLRIMLI